ncbi:hypothetical protein CONPUDRAFT_144950 [Coniophora puteana RWD-64-598 SS2]|uniref:Uncharacterized protein n=1 Tax=Coniophora puteana (strain RWD-64-598) TaxID=741705 RepID=A0A5M3MM07_CONPW|nr:uncharacterized protein CONPUDRAFT_144950 [Coniophora puteana RWD-64-598 SS2]EIW79804.1 hypothetical protein CONPUDRAFT_144950 [Coniophora puteana RWD-64-598 SS2]
MRSFVAIALFIASVVALPFPQGSPLIPTIPTDEVKEYVQDLTTEVGTTAKRDNDRTFFAPLSGDLDGISPLQHFGDVTIDPDLDHPTFGKRSSGDSQNGEVIAPLSGDLDGISPLQNFGDIDISPDLDHPTFGGSGKKGSGGILRRDSGDGDGETNASGDGVLDGMSPLQNFGEVDISPDLDHPTFGGSGKGGSLLRRDSGETSAPGAGDLDGISPLQNFGELEVGPDLDHPTFGKRAGGSGVGDGADGGAKTPDGGILDGISPLQNFGEVTVSPDLDHPTFGDLKRDVSPVPVQADDVTAIVNGVEDYDLD